MTNIRTLLQMVILALAGTLIMGAVSCGRILEPVAPTPPLNEITSQVVADESGGHQLWGFWDCYIPPTQDTIEFVPVRGGQLHLNARRFLEDTVCKDCLKLISIDKDFDNMIITAQIQLIHPFAGLDRYTAFDVRAVVISNGSLYFPGLNARVPDASKGDFTLLNPDGWTRLWNTIEFPPGSGPFKILEYSQGKYAEAGSFTGTVNPYIEFAQDPRSSFPAGGSIIREFKLTLKPGGAWFGYAIDASWEAPLVDPPVDLMTDFPDSANAAEPYVTSIYMDAPLKDQAGDTASLNLDMADRQINWLPWNAQAECPGVWSGVVEPGVWGIGPGEPLWTYVFTNFMVTNETGAPEGQYPALIKVFDSATDPYLGDINYRYELTYIEVIHFEPPQLDGLAVFVAPGPPDPSGMEAPNVFLIDFATMQETMLTDFTGFNEFYFEEPRINPKGTHMLLRMYPNLDNSVVEVYQIGGSHWSVTPVSGYDGDADFHADGQHIIVASGTGLDDTPNLVSMKYDGSERTVIATASGSVRYPRCSPDGQRIAMVITQNSTPMESSIWIYDVPSNQFTQILSGEYQISFPSWNPAQPGGQDVIAFQSTENDPWGWWSDIFVINPDTLEKEMLFDSGISDNHPSWSPDGKSVLFSSGDWGPSDLYEYQVLTQQIAQVTLDDTFDDSPAWSWGW